MDEDRLASLMAELAFAAAVVPIQLPARVGEGDRYELQELLSISNRSHVYLAVDRRFEHEGNDAKVIIKVTAVAERGVLEALTARHIQSPFVVRVLDRGRFPTGEHFLVLEHEPLGDLGMQTLPWSPKKAAQFIAQLASVVQAAHSAGLVHCDLKPGNVLVTERGEPRLTDFDLSNKVLGPDDSSSRGNKAFGAPEQFRGEDGACSPRADIYALGGLLYYVLSGKLPNGESPESVTATNAGLRKRTKLDVPGGLADIVERAMAHAPIDRYATAEQMEADLRAWLELRPLPSKPDSSFIRVKMWCRRNPALTVLWLAMLVGVIAGFVGYLSWSAAEHERNMRTVTQANELAQQEITRLKNRIAGNVESMATALSFVSATASPEKLASTLMMVQDLERVPFDAAAKRLTTAPQQRHLLSTLLLQAKELGREDHLDTQVARLMLAMIEIREGNSEAALSLAKDAEQRWGGRLVKGEALELSQRFVTLTATAFLELKSGPLTSQTRAALENLRAEVSGEPKRPSMVWVINRALRGKPINPGADEP